MADAAPIHSFGGALARIGFDALRRKDVSDEPENQKWSNNQSRSLNERHPVLPRTDNCNLATPPTGNQRALLSLTGRHCLQDFPDDGPVNIDQIIRETKRSTRIVHTCIAVPVTPAARSFWAARLTVASSVHKQRILELWRNHGLMRAAECPTCAKWRSYRTFLWIVTSLLFRHLSPRLHERQAPSSTESGEFRKKDGRPFPSGHRIERQRKSPLVSGMINAPSK